MQSNQFTHTRPWLFKKRDERHCSETITCFNHVLPFHGRGMKCLVAWNAWWHEIDSWFWHPLHENAWICWSSWERGEPARLSVALSQSVTSNVEISILYQMTSMFSIGMELALSPLWWHGGQLWDVFISDDKPNEQSTFLNSLPTFLRFARQTRVPFITNGEKGEIAFLELPLNSSKGEPTPSWCKRGKRIDSYE
jgi:hypothetical protein